MKTLVLVAAFSATVSMAAHAADPSDAQVQAAFKKADLDNDGTVSWLEGRKFGITRPAFTHANPDKDAGLDKIEFKAAIKWQFEHADPDKDGTLDSKEAAKVGVKGKAAFKAADPDKDNTLDLAEYFEVLTRQAK